MNQWDFWAKTPPESLKGLYFDHGFDTIPMHNVSSQIVVDGPGTILQRGLASKLAMLHVPESCLGGRFSEQEKPWLRYRAIFLEQFDIMEWGIKTNMKSIIFHSVFKYFP